MQCLHKLKILQGEGKDFNRDLAGGLDLDVIMQAYVWLEVES